jgi:hypothetical protein
MFAPIALFAYSRPLHTRRTVEALLGNAGSAQSDLIVFSDAARSPDKQQAVAQVRDYVSGIRGFRSLTVVERGSNYGLARSIVEGVTSVLQRHDTVIVVEDDILTAPGFLRYMNDALVRYAADDRVISVHGYMYPVRTRLPAAFFLPGADCWGWGTWRRGWSLFEPDGSKLVESLQQRELTTYFDFNGAHPYTRMLADQVAGKNDSWAVRWYASALLAGKLTLYPGRSLVQNIGNDGSGTHSAQSDVLDVQLNSIEPPDLGGLEVVPNAQCRKAIEEFFLSSRPGRVRSVAGRLLHFAARLARKRGDSR